MLPANLRTSASMKMFMSNGLQVFVSRVSRGTTFIVLQALRGGMTTLRSASLSSRTHYFE